MVSSRPLLYLSLPGVAFILGVFWFRRRNKNHLDSDMKKSTGSQSDKLYSCSKNTEANKNQTMKSVANGSVKNSGCNKLTQPINIDDVLTNEDENILFGKSKPITIAQNGRSTSPAKQSPPQVDSEIITSKKQSGDHKLSSIHEDLENLSSPVDLPDSFDNRMSFYSVNVNVKEEKPVVIIASKTPKISPENSFMESKYTKECDQSIFHDKETVKNDSNDELEKISPSALSKANDIEQTKELNGVTENDSNVSDNTNTNNSVIANETEADANSDEKRNVEAPSPSLSLCSVQTGDSGKGSSLPRSEATRAKTTYEFFLPNSLVGHLYGRKRSHINQIKSKTNATVVLRQKVHTGKLRVCAVEGTENEVQAALELIRQRLPTKRFPRLTMERINFALPQSVVPLSTESLLNLQLRLIEGINNDVVVSAIISGAHLFVQQPLHPSHPSLANLQKCLFDIYTTTEAPLLPHMELSAVCVMPVNGIWYRVQIVDQDSEDAERCIVKFLDFGGFMNVHFNDLRQIRADLLSVPFQAIECVLANIEPIDTCYSAESAEALTKLTKGIVLQAQVAGYNPQNIPEIYLYAPIGPNEVVFINEELGGKNLVKFTSRTD